MKSRSESLWERVIVHADMDAFFAAIEQLDRPDLRNRPIAVGGNGPRSVVATASYEARRFGISSAMPMSIAKRKCPRTDNRTTTNGQISRHIASADGGP